MTRNLKSLANLPVNQLTCQPVNLKFRQRVDIKNNHLKNIRQHTLVKANTALRALCTSFIEHKKKKPTTPPKIA